MSIDISTNISTLTPISNLRTKFPVSTALCVFPMRRKGTPYKFITGDESQAPPIYVSSILNNRVHIKGSEKELTKLNLETELPFTGEGAYEDNSELKSILRELNKEGVAFSYDYKTDLSPSAMMQKMQDSGELETEYKEISWTGPGLWTVTTYELE